MASLRDNLLVTAGARAAYMDSEGCIDLPGGVEGEDILAGFIVKAVNHYLFNDVGPFDLYIEKALLAKFGGDK